MARRKISEVYRETIFMHIHDQSFRNGAFKNSIGQSTEVVNSFNILVASSHLSSSEKQMVKICRKTYIDTLKKWPSEIPDFEDTMKLYRTFEPLGDMFDGDAKDRGLYVPPLTFQLVKADGSVHKSFTLDMNNNVTETEGGMPGIPAGAPENFIKANMRTAEEMDRFMKSKGKFLLNRLPVQDFAQKNAPEMVQTPPTEIREAKKGEEVKSSEGEHSKAKGDDGDFGKGFARNLRGAFM